MPVKQTVLVTGANGQVGGNICKVFDDTFDVVGFSSRKFDVGDAAVIHKIFDEVRPDIVINAAAYTKVDDAEINRDLAERTNFHAAKYLCDACLNHNSLVLSTDFVFDGTKLTPTTKRIQNPLNIYGRSKAGDKYIIENSDQPHFPAGVGV